MCYVVFEHWAYILNVWFCCRWKSFPVSFGLGHGGKEPFCNGHRGSDFLLYHHPHSVPLLLQGQVGGLHIPKIIQSFSPHIVSLDLDLNSLYGTDSTKASVKLCDWMCLFLPVLLVTFQVIHQSPEAYWRRRWGCGQRATEDPEWCRTIWYPRAQTAHQDLQAETEAGSGSAVCWHPSRRGTIQIKYLIPVTITATHGVVQTTRRRHFHNIVTLYISIMWMF